MRKLKDQVWGAVQDVIDALDVLESAGFIDAASNAEEYQESRSERWTDSDKGANYIEWSENLANAAEGIEELRQLLQTVEQAPA